MDGYVVEKNNAESENYYNRIREGDETLRELTNAKFNRSHIRVILVCCLGLFTVFYDYTQFKIMIII